MKYVALLLFSFCAMSALGQSADLVVTKTDLPDPVVAGQIITYSITVRNEGPSAASTVFVSDSAPANTTYVSQQQTGGPMFTAIVPPGIPNVTAMTYTTASFAAGATATFTFRVRVDEDILENSTITNTVTVSSSTPDPNPANNSDTETTAVLGGITVPTLSEWGLLLMAALLAVVAVRR